MYESLKLKPVAIGSLPHSKSQEAMRVVEKYFSEIPFFPQLSNVSKYEDMIVQFLEGMPGINWDNIPQGFDINSESEKFYEDLEIFFADYEDIISDINSEKLEKYAISERCSSTFEEFINIIKSLKPEYAKGQIIGPFTLSTSLKDINGKNLVFDETLRDIITKLLCLKVIWQIVRIKRANSNTIPIIFMDEPTLSQLGTSAYMTVTEEDVHMMLSEIVETVHSYGGICAIHCCGKCDWSIPIKASVDIINLDGYSFAQHLSLYSDEVNKFLKNGGKIAWGIVPTLDFSALEDITEADLIDKFEICLKYLTNKGIDEKLITDNSLVTSSCGAGSLSEVLAERAMSLVRKLSHVLREKY